jgi:spore coat polysaccharide biosynthesis protein SpsF
MTTGAIVQARMSSARLPGKVLLEVEGKPLLQYVIERLQRARLDVIVVTTSVDPSDDAVDAFCDRAGVDCHRGSLDDVAGRVLETAESWHLDSFVRISGDSPLLDQQLVDQATALLAGEWDLATNVFPRTFPKGQSVEAIRRATFKRGYEAMTDPDDLEHVTTFFYRHPEEFRIRSFGAPAGLPDVSLAVDTADDVAAFEAIVGRMKRPHWTYTLEEIVQLATAGKGEAGT